ncbi:Cell wall-associated hydrolase, NlpC family [Arthrobacter sp. yr096]|uniref:C40 family peptidase n=1 Tax=unclassified Arthrobacter TaxID=235627 RepID=UPI00089B72BB|nr:MULTISPECIES: C40 family peptidase [unclassified Arthrobacter]SDV99858.1 Cell wall-associated hydrolase, NlpC family [Arthrobacter sp. cf158]SEI83401.1 Cell wall-associated hydrolase, NlpC family [Arthrobacter sp. yr096]
MSMTDAIGRIQTIEASLQQLAQGARVSAASSSSSSVSAASAADAASFASALSSAMGTSSSSASLASGLSAAGLGSLLPAAGSTTPTSGAAAVGASGGAVSGDAVVAAAKKYIGVPYVWGGTNPAVGMDCSGFVQRVFKDLGVELPRVVSDQMQKGTPVASLAEAKPGDLLVSYGGEHISIYLGNGKAIDAPVPGQTIQIRDAWEKYSNLTSIRRIVPAGGS